MKPGSISMPDTPGLVVPRERVALRLAVFGLGLALAFAGAFGIGRAVGPLHQDAPPAMEQDMDMDH